MTANTHLHGADLLKEVGLAWNQQRRVIGGRTHVIQALRYLRKKKRLAVGSPQVGSKLRTRDAQLPLELDRTLIADKSSVEPFADLCLRDFQPRGESGLRAGELDCACDGFDAGALDGSAIGHGRKFITVNDITSTTNNNNHMAHNRAMKKKAVYAGFFDRLCEAAEPLLGEGFTQHALGDLFGVRQATVSSNWAKDRLPEMDRLAEMAATFRVNLQWLVYGTGPRDVESEDPRTRALLELATRDELFRELVRQWELIKDDVQARVFVLQAAQLHAAKAAPRPTTPAPVPVPPGKRRTEKA